MFAGYCTAPTVPQDLRERFKNAQERSSTSITTPDTGSLHWRPPDRLITKFHTDRGLEALARA